MRDPLTNVVARLAAEEGALSDDQRLALIERDWDKPLSRVLAEDFAIPPERVRGLMLRAMLAAEPATAGPSFQHDRYEILRELGRGGMGVVYLARDLALQRDVALKLTWVPATANPLVEKRFLKEARVMARLRHPNIAAIHDAGRRGDYLYYTMDPLEGGSLQDLLAGRPELHRVLAILANVARAMHYVHEEGLVHRDLKPSNILFDGRRTPFVTDFGLTHSIDAASRMTLSGSVMGTPCYMSPEQAAGSVEDLDRRTDVYSLGAILYEAATGRPPFAEAAGAQDLHRRLLEAEVPRPARLNARIDRRLEDVIMKAIAKDRRHRYADAQALAEDLERYLEGRAVGATGAWKTRRVLRQVERRSKRFLAAGVGAAFAAVLLWAVVGAARHEDRTLAMARLRHRLEEARELRFRDRPYADFRSAISSVLGDIERERAAHPEDWELPLLLALGHHLLGEYETAIERANEALERTDADVARVLRVRSRLELYHRRQLAQRQPDPRMLDAIRADLAQIGLEDVHLELGLIEALRDFIDGRHRESLARCDGLLQAAREREYVELLMARNWRALGDPRRAEAHATAALAHYRHYAPALELRSELAEARGAWPEAESDLTRLLEVLPNDAGARLRRAELRSLRCDDCAGALEDAREAARLALPNFYAYSILGGIWQRCARRAPPQEAPGLLDSAIELHTRALEVGRREGAPEDAVANLYSNRAHAWYELAGRRDRERNLERAEADAREALRLNRSEENALSTLAAVAQERQNHAEAIRLLTEALACARAGSGREEAAAVRRILRSRSWQAVARDAEARSDCQAALDLLEACAHQDASAEGRLAPWTLEAKERLHELAGKR